jgi:molybdopterin converting factor small subunit
MHVQVRLMPWFSELLSPEYTSAVLVDEDLPSGSTLRGLIGSLAGRSPRLGDALYCSEQGTLHHAVVVTCNGRLVSPAQALDLVLQSGDQLVFAPAYSGGD